MTTSLGQVLASLGPTAVAVSGGVDSMTLAVFAHRLLGHGAVEMMHAVSPAVPAEATDRVRRFATLEGWNLHVLDAREFADPNYRANPVNRCFFCKSNLYTAIAGLTGRQIVSGANTDDLGEYRPGLDAARERAVRHPYLEADMSKREVRELSRTLGLGTLADLPASPCLSSRIETAIAIDPAMLGAVHAAEGAARALLDPSTVRCRVRRDRIVIELDEACLGQLGAETRAALARSVSDLFRPVLPGRPIAFAPYRNGSAFVGAKP